MKRFYKVHELGTDFVLFDGRSDPETDWNALSKHVCDRYTGIGATGALILLPSDVADVRMRRINADGSDAQSYGDGIRALARFAFEAGMVHGAAFSVEAGADVLKVRVILKDGHVDGVRVDLGMPLLDAGDIPVKAESRPLNLQLTADGRTFTFSSVRVGAPHTVLFVDALNEADVLRYGPPIERDPLFLEGTNVDFIEIPGLDRIKLRTWERGTGYTPACAEGAGAAVVAAVLGGKLGRKAAVELAHGTLDVEWSADDNHVYLTGPAEIVFSGICHD